jgi:hypothetical protein
VASVCSELFLENKDPDEETIRGSLYDALTSAHPEEIEKIEGTPGGWKKYWSEVLQTLVS